MLKTNVVADLKARLDVVTLIGQTVALKKRGAVYVGFCPFHTNTRTPAFAVFPKTQTWQCFGTCATGGDVVTFVMKRDGLTYAEALAQLIREVLVPPVPLRAPPRLTVSPPVPNTPPSATWQATGWRLIERAEQRLWQNGDDARCYLHEERHLTDATLQRWRVGVIPRNLYMSFAAWGLSPDPTARGVWLPAGLVIPTFTADGVLWAIHVRRWEGPPKYPHIRGSKKSLWGTQNVLDQSHVLFCGGEFDAMLAQQEVGHLAGCCSPSTGEGSTWASEWTSYLLSAEHILVAYDADRAGQTGAWKNVLAATSRARLCPPPTLRPGDKDLTHFAQAGGNLAQWVAEVCGLER